MEKIGMTLTSGLSPERASDLARQLANDLRHQSDLSAEIATRPAVPGERSVAVPMLGQLAITFLSGGAAVALINCLKAYIERDRTLRVRLRRDDGAELELETSHLQSEAVAETVEVIKRFVGAGGDAA